MRTKRAQNNSAIPHSFFTTRQSAEWVAACSPGYRLAGLKERLMAPELVRELIRAFREEINRAAAEREQQVRADRLHPGGRRAQNCWTCRSRRGGKLQPRLGRSIGRVRAPAGGA